MRKVQIIIGQIVHWSSQFPHAGSIGPPKSMQVANHPLQVAGVASAQLPHGRQHSFQAIVSSAVCKDRLMRCTEPALSCAQQHTISTDSTFHEHIWHEDGRIPHFHF